MTEPSTITIYTDYKSPYAYLAKDLVYDLARDVPVRLDWRPYILDIPSFLGSARVDASGNVLEEARNAHQWRRVRYSYMDCRREAQKRGLTILAVMSLFIAQIDLILRNVSYRSMLLNAQTTLQRS